MVIDLTTRDYLFLKYRSVHIKLEDVVKEYYPNLSKENMLARAREKRFPFTCYRIDESQKGAFFVNLQELAEAIDHIYRTQYSIFQNKVQKAIQSVS
ncbi:MULTISPECIES: pyocin activator PrtN family protein [Acinetobacter]|jgi:hypothetical protein|uniref:Pyocin activator protein PrtN n=2 Tax=Acinetobacter TaxID=469 RepID=R9ANP2_9GAMM|nr:MULTISPECIES: pyocin activator PrtN family protein [Acinetobacter]ENX51455.1 hypothetical protein F902_04332 [Acinetobacter higginsii]EOR02209.1 hypothetical protein F896_03896 [Acinetobacter genomosp. 15BJ]EOR03857.1 hypothetical protein F896_03393 [Acinetobacter genomosp. 15BJ]